MIEETYRTKAIVVRRQPFREHDLSITIYGPEKGKQTLVARGARKFRSKVAAHVEPFCFIDCLVVRGKAYDYIGSALSESCLPGLKGSEPKVTAAGRALRLFDQLVKAGTPDPDLFLILRDFLCLLDEAGEEADAELLANLFLIRLVSCLGHSPELYRCVTCGQDLQPGGNGVQFRQGGAVCPKCLAKAGGLTISDEAVKVLRLANNLEVFKFGNIRVGQELADEVAFIVNDLIKQHQH